MQSPIDFYTLKAHLSPALLAALPLVVTGISLFPKLLDGWKSLYAIAVCCGFIYLLAELGRRAGTLRQERLFRVLGGKPSIVRLRHRQASNKTLVAERHRKLTILFPQFTLPSPEEEKKKPEEADEIYDAVARGLIERTRDKKIFPLLFQENCSYGFWRNLWGLKPAGILASLLAIASIAAVSFLKPTYFSAIDKKTLVAPLVLDIGFLLLWIFWVTPKSIRIPAEAYSERLFEASDELIRQDERQKAAK